VQLWQATTIGGLVGLVVGMGLELGRTFYREYYQQQTIEEYERLGMSPPLMTDLLAPWSLAVFMCLLLAIVGSSVYVIWSIRKA
jgi:hypothetical protein